MNATYTKKVNSNSATVAAGDVAHSERPDAMAASMEGRMSLEGGEQGAGAYAERVHEVGRGQGVGRQACNIPCRPLPVAQLLWHCTRLAAGPSPPQPTSPPSRTPTPLSASVPQRNSVTPHTAIPRPPPHLRERQACRQEAVPVEVRQREEGPRGRGRGNAGHRERGQRVGVCQPCGARCFHCAACVSCARFVRYTTGRAHSPA